MNTIVTQLYTAGPPAAKGHRPEQELPGRAWLHQMEMAQWMALGQSPVAPADTATMAAPVLEPSATPAPRATPTAGGAVRRSGIGGVGAEVQAGPPERVQTVAPQASRHSPATTPASAQARIEVDEPMAATPAQDDVPVPMAAAVPPAATAPLQAQLAADPGPMAAALPVQAAPQAPASRERHGLDGAAAPPLNVAPMASHIVHPAGVAGPAVPAASLAWAQTSVTATVPLAGQALPAIRRVLPAVARAAAAPSPAERANEEARAQALDGNWEASAMKIIKSGNGVELLIRDSSLAQAQFLSLAYRMVGNLAGSPLSLRSVMINGQSAYRAAADSESDQFALATEQTGTAGERNVRLQHAANAAGEGGGDAN